MRIGKVLTTNELLEQQVLSLQLKIKDLEKDIQYQYQKINSLTDEIIILEVVNSLLENKIKELIK